MKKYMTIMVLCIILFFCLGSNVLSHADLLAQSVQKDSGAFKDIAYAASDSKGNIYIIDRYRTRMVKLDQEGNRVFTVDQNGFFQNTDSFFNELTVDESGNIYAVCDMLDSGGNYTTEYEIREYDRDGRFSKVLDTINYAGIKTVSRGNYIDLKVIGNDLCYYITNGKVTTRYLVSLTSGKKFSDASFQTGDADNLFKVTGIGKDFLYYETKDKKIYRTDQNGNTQELFDGNRSNLQKEIAPRKLMVNSDGVLYFLDQLHSKVYTISPDRNFRVEEYLSLEKYVQNGDFSTTGTYTALMPLTRNHILVGDEDTYMILDQNGNRIREGSVAGMSAGFLARVVLFWAQAVLCVLFLAAVILLWYFKILKRRIILFFKYALALIPSSLIIMIVIGFYMYGVVTQNSVHDRMEKLEVASRSGSMMIDGDLLDRIQTSEQCMKPAFRSKLSQVEDILQVKKEGRRIAGMYAVIYKKVGDGIYILYDFDWNTMPFTLYAEHYKTSDMAELFDKGSNYEDTDDEDVNGKYMDSVTPIYNSKHQIVGAFEAGVYMYSIDSMMKSLMHWFLTVVLCGTLVLALLILLISRAILNSLKTLRRGVSEMSRGNLAVSVHINAHDEVSDLCDGFNIMANHIRESVRLTKQTSEAYFHFVPERMLRLLGKESIVHIRAGDTVRKDMSVMWIEIRSFYSVSANLSAEQSYAYINGLLEKFGPAIRANGGMVEKYLGSDISAVFPEKADGAVQSAVGIISLIGEINAEQKGADTEKLDIGISLYKGNAMLGTIGEEKRMECTMILDDGNILQYMCKLTARLGVSILTTESVMRALENKDRYLYRYMGKVRLENAAGPIRIYDVFQGDRESVRKLRTETKESFEEGIRLYETGRYLEARSRFIGVLRRDREDGAARVYFYLSDESYRKGKKVSLDSET